MEEKDFKLIDKIVPAVQNGRQSLTASQRVTQDNAEVGSYSARQDYIIARRLFTLGAEEVFGVYPANGEAGDFANTIPYITLSDRTFPWSFGEKPFAALLVLKDNEIIGEGEITVKELFDPASDTYFPQKTELPSVYFEEENEYCRFIDISKQVYDDIFPSDSDISLLAHAKLLDLSRAPDDICVKDGYFSSILANRFVPTDTRAETSCVCHLVTALGYGEKIPESFDKVRLVSLYSWNIRSHSEKGRPFAKLAEGMSKNCGAIGCGSLNGETAVMPHYTRTGEMTYSLYRSPLASEERDIIPELSQANTADGRLIYDKENGVFDVSYAAAFQLGRLITLSRPETAEKLLEWRNRIKDEFHGDALNMLAQDMTENFDFDVLSGLLAEYAER